MDTTTAAQILGRKGGRAGRGAGKDRSTQMLSYWAKVRAGEVPAPRRKGIKRKPKQRELPLDRGSA